MSDANDLSPRAVVALKRLHELTTPYAAAPSNNRDDAGWAKWLDEQPKPFKRTHAFEIETAIKDAGLQSDRSRHPTNGAGNTLSALKRRGLAANDGGGAWLSAKWWVTPEGAERAKALPAEEAKTSPMAASSPYCVRCGGFIWQGVCKRCGRKS